MLSRKAANINYSLWFDQPVIELNLKHKKRATSLIIITASILKEIHVFTL
jgi:hypothetical protein